ncbi:MAG: hypothetical protein KGH98_02685 [Candidatus Micrarchaeota archaeon]|nr:hypothetical protein [Candidatus Micrarchaeota archaeon]
MIGKGGEQKGQSSLPEVLEILHERKKHGELTYEQGIAEEHAKKFAIEEAKAKKARKALEELGILKDQTIINLVDVMPKTEALVKQILAAEKKGFSPDEIAKILAITKDKASA